LTGDQVFFYSFAQAWCSKQSVKAERMQAVTDPHSPNEFRINGAIHNAMDFGQVFQCKPGSKMTPPTSKRCLVWVNANK